MKHKSKRPKKYTYPRSVLASLKGDETACLKFWGGKIFRTRRERKKWKAFEQEQERAWLEFEKEDQCKQ